MSDNDENDLLRSAHSDDNDIYPLDEGDDDNNNTDNNNPTTSTSSKRKKTKLTRDDLPVFRHHDRVFLFHATNAAEHVITFFSLPHVRNTAHLVRFAIAQRTLFEIQACREVAASWFVDESVVRDGTLYIATPVDPLFVLLPRLQQVRQAGVFVEASVVFDVLDVPAYQYLGERFLPPTPWHLVCDVKQMADLLVLRLSDEKLAHWLNAKTVAVHDAMKTDDRLKRFAQSASSKAVAATFKQSSSDANDMPQYDFVRNAVAYVTEYLTTEQANALAERFGVRSAAADTHPLSLAKRMVSGASAGSSKTQSKELDDIMAHVRKVNEKQKEEAAAASKKKLSLGQRQLAKVDTSKMKRMSSFFAAAKKAKTNDATEK